MVNFKFNLKWSIIKVLMCYTGNWFCLPSPPPHPPNCRQYLLSTPFISWNHRHCFFLWLEEQSTVKNPFYPTLNKAHDRMCVPMHIHHTHTAHAYTLDNVWSFLVSAHMLIQWYYLQNYSAHMLTQLHYLQNNSAHMLTQWLHLQNSSAHMLTQWYYLESNSADMLTQHNSNIY